MISFKDVRDLPEARRLGKFAAAALCVWVVGFILLMAALSVMGNEAERLADSDKVLSAGCIVKSYPVLNAPAGQEPVAALSAITDSLGLRERVTQMNSGPSGLVLEMNGLYPEELTRLIEEISRGGLSIRTADIRGMSSGGGKGGRLINVAIALEGSK